MNLINKWTRELRYHPYEKWGKDYRDQLNKTVNQSIWRLDYHIQPVTGLLNDPNGFTFFNGKWHLFYQFYPFGPVHGLKSWFHLTSANLVDWKEEGIRLLPDSLYDSHGVYSGSALAIDDQLLLAYTGNVRNADWERSTYQLGAYMDKKHQINKMETPLVSGPPKGYTTNFRDPQVIFYQDHYLMIIGAQTTEEKGEVLLYKSKDLKDWQFLGPLNFTQQSLGFMVECPNLIFIDQQAVLIFCPQGLDKNELSYQNIYPNTYVIGQSFDERNRTIEHTSPIHNLDSGFDLYATQAFNAPDGRALSISWIGLPELSYPTDQEGWAHCLSIVKELKIKDGQLLQQPVAEQKNLRYKKTALLGDIQNIQNLMANNETNRYELNLNLQEDSRGSLYLFADSDNSHYLALHFDAVHGKIELDRKQLRYPLNKDFGQTRAVTLENHQSIDLQIFADQSVCEIFVNQGRHVFTTRVFPETHDTGIFLAGTTGAYTGDFWTLRSAR
ncbi:sucrose-6-phosphate hydrolase [Tetragenococcus halophilus]|uniref:Sucrose-6-phosphate hydrolase n=1 Tax=Tetragenococcus halophilus TaxID=51669 RepID=A0AB35HQK8_TETHA|nr:sucrose-6-phosphate hydrolase [Tetragenococcus halophilus]MCO8298090.1 sucrose-6-phosphate hydrolase [Tetragenococcus halophilus]